MRKKNKIVLYFVVYLLLFCGYTSVNKVLAAETTPTAISETSESADQNNSTTLNESNQSVDGTTPASQNTSTSVKYESHVQNNGWQEEKKDGELSGTTGESKRLEAVNISLVNPEYQGNINYQAHVQDIGWQTTVWGGEVAGTVGQAKRLEAVKMWLTGDMANYYSIQYRVHIQDIGWQDWARDGIIAGTIGLGKRIEAIEIRLIDLRTVDPDIYYSSHVQDKGWTGNVQNGQTSGTTGQSKRMEAFTVGLNNSKYGGDVIYQAHVQDIGWQNWVKNGQVAGTTGLGKSLQAICIALTGNIANDYSIYYRVHSSDFGWLDWASDGNVAGTTGLGKAIEAIQIHLMKKIDLKALETNSEVSSICDRKGYKNGVAVTGWKNINGDIYYFGNDGVLVVNQSIKKDGKQGYVNKFGKFVLSNSGLPSNDFVWNGPKLTAQMGVNYGPTGKETYYNLPMGGVVAIMRGLGYSEAEYPYWVRSDGVKMFGNYVMVAAHLGVFPRGSLVNCSLGKAIVCDTGSFAYGNPYQLDIATNWQIEIKFYIEFYDLEGGIL